MVNGQGTVDDAYLEWLYTQIGAVNNRNPTRSYWALIKQMHSKQFIPFIHNDGNRAENGKRLRFEFLDWSGYPLYDPLDLWVGLECSILEMLIALARDLAHETDSTTLEWFWVMMKNIEVDRYSDELYGIHIAEEVEDTLDRVIQRSYSSDGVGGLFPLRDNHGRDQRRVEIWYQKEAYLLEGLYANVAPAEKGR